MLWIQRTGQEQDKNTSGQTTKCRKARGIRSWSKPKPQWFDGRTNIEEDDWTDFKYAYEFKGVSKLKKNLKKAF